MSGNETETNLGAIDKNSEYKEVLASVEMSSPDIKNENPSPAFDPTANKSPQ